MTECREISMSSLHFNATASSEASTVFNGILGIPLIVNDDTIVFRSAFFSA